MKAIATVINLEKKVIITIIIIKMRKKVGDVVLFFFCFFFFKSSFLVQVSKDSLELFDVQPLDNEIP